MKSIKTYESYVRRANFYELFRFKRKAIEVMKEISNQPFSNLEIGSGYIYIGFMYKDLKDLTSASHYFESALNLCKHEYYPYSPNHKKIIEYFVENGEFDKASKWYEHLIERASYEKKFLKLKKLN
ncbi:tetratricopeptide (TPR) repeat protein [Planomicrobium sp. HSC-17F08]|nr:tetratricopeptide (TPR) repeat protein [Planomicrobium sp. HSC-17F08]